MKRSHPGLGLRIAVSPALPNGQRTSALSRREAKDAQSVVSGGDIDEATPDPIPNSEVKLVGADGTAWEAMWESRTLPGFFLQGLLPS